MKHSINQLLSYSVILNCLILCGCITEYKAKGIKEVTDILVVQGIITDDESFISITQSVNLNEKEYSEPLNIENAIVYVECDDETKTEAGVYEPSDSPTWATRVGRYRIKTGQLNLARKYRLKIEFNNHEYVSDFSYPIETPEIDSLFWIKTGAGLPVMIHVSTHSPNNDVLYYQWSFKEDWEYHAIFKVRRCPIHNINVVIENDWESYFCPVCEGELEEPYPYICWNSVNNNEMLLGSSERTVFGQLIEKILDINPTDIRLSVLYRITVNQNAISKRAHDYFVNIKKNSENIGSIFAPTPSELRGNIVCTTDPRRPVIGYIDISTTTQKNIYISESDVFEGFFCCPGVQENAPLEWFILIYSGGWRDISCIDCTWHDKSTQKPDDWPEIDNFVVGKYGFCRY